MLTTRPRATVTVKRRVSVGAVGCNCGSGSAANVMRTIGMKTAARMHGKTAKASDWTPEDWRAHIAEERTILFPALLAAGAPQSVIDSLDIDHSLYLALLDAGQPLPTGAAPHSVDRHGKIEDDLVEKHAKALLARSGVSVSGAPAGHTLVVVAPESAFSDDAIANYIGSLQDVIDASITTDEEDAKAKTADARKKYTGWARSVAGFAGGPVAGKMAGDWAGAVFDAGRWIASTFGSDDLKDANSGDQKSRMRDRVTLMLKKGLPPHGFDAGEEMGARDVADVIDDDLSIVAAVSPHGEGDTIAAAITNALKGQGDASAAVAKLFATLAIVRTDTRRTMWGGASATYLIDKAGQMRPGTDDWQITHPEVEIAAAAFAANRHIPLATAIGAAYDALNTYASRRGLTNRNDFLGPAYHPRDPQVTDDVARWYNKYGRADAIIDAWDTLSMRFPSKAAPATHTAWYVAVFALAGYLAWRVAA